MRSASLRWLFGSAIVVLVGPSNVVFIIVSTRGFSIPTASWMFGTPSVAFGDGVRFVDANGPCGGTVLVDVAGTGCLENWPVTILAFCSLLLNSVNFAKVLLIRFCAFKCNFLLDFSVFRFLGFFSRHLLLCFE